MWFIRKLSTEVQHTNIYRPLLFLQGTVSQTAWHFVFFKKYNKPIHRFGSGCGPGGAWLVIFSMLSSDQLNSVALDFHLNVYQYKPSPQSHKPPDLKCSFQDRFRLIFQPH